VVAPPAPRTSPRARVSRRVRFLAAASAVAALAGLAPAASAAPFADGFEQGDLSAWRVTGKPRVQAMASASGRRALEAPRRSAPSYVRRDVAGATMLNVSFRYRPADRRGALSARRPRVVLRLPANGVALEDVGGRLMLRVEGARRRVSGRIARGWTRVALRLDADQDLLRTRTGGGRWTGRRASLEPETGVLLGDLDSRRNGPAYFDDVAIDARGADGGPLDVTDPAPDPTGEASAPAPERRLFAADSFWNAPLAHDAPVDPASGPLVAELVSEVARVAAVRDGPWIAARQYSTPVYVVGPGQPTVRVQLDHYTPSNLQGAFEAVPIPADAKEAPGDDQHLTVWQPATDTLWEFWKASKEANGWHARWGGAIRNVSASPGYYTKDSWPGAEPYWGASATSLPIVGGTMMVDELRRGRIDHALALALPRPKANVFSWPAQRTDGFDTREHAIPEGARFRLDPALDLDDLKLHPFVRMMAEAAQRYGIVVRDKSSSVQFFAEDPAQFGQNPYGEIIGPQYPNETYKLLATFPWQHLQVLKMDLRSRG
jgi:hypothetical protein